MKTVLCFILLVLPFSSASADEREGHGGDPLLYELHAAKIRLQKLSGKITKISVYTHYETQPQLLAPLSELAYIKSEYYMHFLGFEADYTSDEPFLLEGGGPTWLMYDSNIGRFVVRPKVYYAQESKLNAVRIFHRLIQTVCSESKASKDSRFCDFIASKTAALKQSSRFYSKKWVYK